MIQRIQTVWMILASFATFLTIKFSFFSGLLISNNTNHPVSGTTNLILLILTSALGTGILINIFLFKQRSVQFRIMMAAIVLECLIIFLYIRETSNYSDVIYSIGAALHPLIIMFLFFAARGVYRDSKLIKESNRLR